MTTIGRAAHPLPILALALWMLALAVPVRASVQAGDAAPDFTKDQWNAPAPAARSLSDYSGKVVVLFLFGYSCPFCLSDGPSVEADLWQYYQSVAPGQVQVLGVDMYNGGPAQVASFQAQTGATFPLLLYGGLSTGGNLNTLYGGTPTYDNYAIISKQGIVRYYAANLYAHGNRYHLNEMRAAVDSLITSTVGVPPLAGVGLSLAGAPNPFQGALSLALTAPAGARVRVSAHAANGRLVSRVYDGTIGADGAHRVTWYGTDTRGSQLAPGVYWLRATAGDQVVTQRVALVH